MTFEEFKESRIGAKCGDYIREKMKNNEKDVVLLRSVLEKRIGLIYGSNSTDEEINEVLNMAIKCNKSTGEALGWIFENFSEKDKFEPAPEKFKVLEGGLAEDMTVDEIAEKHGVSASVIEEQIEMGKEVEKEHTNDPDIAERIAMDHLVEIPDYYTRLKKMEEEAKEEMKG